MQRVLFVCVENSCRSQIAEAFARLHGREIVEAYSAGSRPSGRVHPAAVAAMGEIGYDLNAHTSKSLADLAGIEFDLAITMGCGDECPITQAREFEDWKIPDPKNLPPAEFRAVRDSIETQVKALLTRLQNESK
jgi:arsenate reductase (thioredoxin)